MVPFSFPDFKFTFHHDSMLTCGDLAQVCGFHDEWQADYVFIQLGRNKSWNAKGDQFPKNIWVLNGLNMSDTFASLSSFSTKPISRAASTVKQRDTRQLHPINHRRLRWQAMSDIMDIVKMKGLGLAWLDMLL